MEDFLTLKLSRSESFRALKLSMKFCQTSHHSQLPHYESQDPNNVLSVGQTIPEENMKNLSDPVTAPLIPGQVKSDQCQFEGFNIHYTR